jgi:hypothetical protein
MPAHLRSCTAIGQDQARRVGKKRLWELRAIINALGSPDYTHEVALRVFYATHGQHCNRKQITALNMLLASGTIADGSLRVRFVTRCGRLMMGLVAARPEGFAIDDVATAYGGFLVPHADLGTDRDHVRGLPGEPYALNGAELAALMKQCGQLGVDQERLGPLVQLALHTGVGYMANSRAYIFQKGRAKRLCRRGKLPNVKVVQQPHHLWIDGVSSRSCLFLVAVQSILHDEELVCHYSRHPYSKRYTYECMDETHYTPEEWRNRENN